jgi:hypothetical protein
LWLNTVKYCYICGIELFKKLKENLMKRVCRNFIVTSVLFAAFSAFPVICNAQGDPGDDPDAPIDGGVSILIAAGVGYGIKKANDQRKKHKNKTTSLEQNNSL